MDNWTVVAVLSNASKPFDVVVLKLYDGAKNQQEPARVFSAKSIKVAHAFGVLLDISYG